MITLNAAAIIVNDQRIFLKIPRIVLNRRDCWSHAAPLPTLRVQTRTVPPQINDDDDIWLVAAASFDPTV